MRVVSILLALMVALGVSVWLALDNAPEPEEAAAQSAGEADARVVDVRALRSRAEPMTTTLRLRGVAEADREVTVRAQTAGLVVSTPKKKGAAITAGELLCQLEDGGRAAELKRAEAQLKQAAVDARASGALARRGFSAEVTVAADEAALEAARAEVAAMTLDLARTQIVAPFDGLLETDAAETGMLLSVGDACATVIDLDPIRLVGFAPEVAVADLPEPGGETPVQVGVRLLNGTEFLAELSFVARSADEETRTFRIEATAPNPDGAIRDGATVSMAVVKTAVPAHRLPHSALTLDDAGRLGVRLARSPDEAPTSGPAPETPVAAVAEFRIVEILRDDADGVWAAGLPEVADVILVGQDFVTDGSPVRAFYGAAAAQAPASAIAAGGDAQ